MKHYRIAFIIIWFTALLVPLFHINTSEIAEQENRTLARFSQKKKGQLNFEFGKEFEDWLGDRFWGRNQLIDARFQTMYKINGRIENDRAFVGDDGWMFMKEGIVNVPSLTKQRENIEKDIKILKRLGDKYKGKNIPIFLVLIPDRNQLYQKYWERYYTPKSRLDYGEQLIEALKDYPNIHIIYPKDEFIKTIDKGEELFIKTDTHLTFNGESILRKKVYEIIKKIYFPKYKIDYIIVSPSNRKKQYIANLLGIHKVDYLGDKSFFIKDIKFIPTHKFTLTVFGKLRDVENVWAGMEITISNKPIISKKIYVVGGCFMQGMNRLFAPIFKNTFYFRTNTWDDEEEIANQNKYFKQYLHKIKEGDILMLSLFSLESRYIKQLLKI